MTSTGTPAGGRAVPLLLLAGFEPFGGERFNPSGQIARQLEGEVIGGLLVRALELPVTYGRAPALLARAIAELSPAAMLGLGQAGARAAIALERIAINLMDSTAPDNAGGRMRDQRVVVGGPDAYFARLPLRQIMRALDRRHIPCELSLSAGSFLCNAVMYAGLHELRRRPHVPCGFLHLPYDTAQAVHHRGTPSLPLDLMAAAVRTAIAVIGAWRFKAAS
ncbi:MAG TPA: pyroglutamyl-peptidase I [Candidatus Binataceae bacterium]|nr:pyroglutamyl-peptidase I [Candidatus Binataceae bacterium]